MSRRDQIRALQHLVKHSSKGGADPRLTADEVLAVRSGGAHPDDYVALPVQVNVDQGRQGMIASTPEGPVIVMPLVLGVPVQHVRVTRVLGADGQVRSPLEGMLPTLYARLVVPRARLTAEVLAQLDVLGVQGDVVDELEEGAVNGRGYLREVPPLSFRAELLEEVAQFVEKLPPGWPGDIATAIRALTSEDA